MSKKLVENFLKKLIGYQSQGKYKYPGKVGADLMREPGLSDDRVMKGWERYSPQRIYGGLDENEIQAYLKYAKMANALGHPRNHEVTDSFLKTRIDTHDIERDPDTEYNAFSDPDKEIFTQWPNSHYLRTGTKRYKKNRLLHEEKDALKDQFEMLTVDPKTGRYYDESKNSLLLKKLLGLLGKGK